MKRHLILLALLLPFLQGIAQYDCFVYENGRFQPEMTVHVFAEQCQLRARPAIDAADLLPLAQGDKVLILSNTMVETESGGVKQYWYQVEYTNTEGRATVGFLRGHDLAIGALTFMINYRRDLLLLQITGFNEGGSYTLTARVVRNGNTVRQQEYPFIEFHLNIPYPRYSIAVNKNIQTGIDSISEVAEITFFHQDAEYPSGVSYLIWNGEHLGRLCETMYLKEPGLFEYDSYLVYPGREGVLPGTVKQVEVTREYDETREEYIETERYETVYRWDGVKIRTGD